ncbi:MAG: aerotolerance regulator BatA [Bacteroidetes bacterium CG12_big_fil_rev_8_21_14_0_65_60_17]|nr:MAG: aerotolerance regulator BatA [Bacteroidetes bacterium CG12_big_fil_rev_8_21_14_0_65_60_17]
MEFQHPYWLLLLPVVAGGAVRAWKARTRRAALVYSAAPTAARARASARARLRDLPLLVRTLSLALVVLALARPQQRDVVRERYAEGIDIVLTIDTSTSMRAEDFRPNRFEAARQIASDFISGRVSDRIGLVVFAAQAFTQAPLTLDYDFLLSMLGEVETGMIEDGTAIGTALATSVNALRNSDAESKVVILLTDGQNNRGEISPETAAEVAQALGVRVYTIGTGAQGEAPFIVDHPFSGRQRRMVPVEIDEEMMTKVAESTGGRYFRATDNEALRRIYEQIGELETTRVQELEFVDVQENYLRFLLPAFLLVLFETLLSTTILRRFP